MQYDDGKITPGLAERALAYNKKLISQKIIENRAKEPERIGRVGWKNNSKEGI